MPHSHGLMQLREVAAMQKNVAGMAPYAAVVEEAVAMAEGAVPLEETESQTENGGSTAEPEPVVAASEAARPRALAPVGSAHTGKIAANRPDAAA